MTTLKKSNRLILEKSPYLLQHAFNPVEWHAWGEEAFQRARLEQKPIFLSIGYSTCHWCHVMEREAFESDAIAAMMNAHFVCIKVDREERPDVDKVYMTALQGMGQNGGWPLSMFLTPDLEPFYGGTYFPPETRHGRVGFSELLGRVHQLWLTDRQRITDSAHGMAKFLKETPSVLKGKEVTPAAIEKCFEQATAAYDGDFGGFGGAPKFPRPVVFNCLLRYFHGRESKTALDMVEHSLKKMTEGGIYDHVGGGFHRYSVDGEWRVPHFEKMLYDQAQLVRAYADLFLITHNPDDERVIREVLDYVLRDMTSPDGAFYSAEDADSPRPDDPAEEGEGAFYLWTKKEILALLGEEDADVFGFCYGVEEAGNALADPQAEFTGRNILYVARTIPVAARVFNRSEQEIATLLERGRRKLFATRKNRPRPRLDDKVLTSWNGLMISAFARSSTALDEPRYLEAARRAAASILARLYDKGKHSLYRRYRDGETKFDANLDDYAFLAQAMIDLYEASLECYWIATALELTTRQIEIFWDHENGGFFDTSGVDASVLVRMKEQYDGAEPTGNAIAVMNLLRLAHLTDNDKWRGMAERTLELFGELLGKHPFAMPQMVAALDFFLAKVKQVVIAGRKEDPAVRRMLREVHSRYLPNTILLFADGGEEQKQLGEYVPFINSLSPQSGKPMAYVCEDYVCQLPATEVSVLAGLLGGQQKS